MLMNKVVGKTMKKQDEEYYSISEELLIRSGMLRKIGPGSFVALPMGEIVLSRIIGLIRNNLEKMDFQRIKLPADDFLRNVSLAIRNDIKSYKELPALLYDLQILHRDETKVKEGLLKAKEFELLRAIGLYTEDHDVETSNEDLLKGYVDIFKDLGLDILVLEDYNPKAPKENGNSLIVKNQWGDRVVFTCEACRNSFLEETMSFSIEENICGENSEIEEVFTPDIKTIEELEKFLGVEAKELAKTLLVKAREEVVAVVLRGDRELNLYKLSKALNIPADEIKMADKDDIMSLNTVTGFVGPVNLKKCHIIIDKEIAAGGLYITGANKKDYHFRNVNPLKEIENYIIEDISYVSSKDRCPACVGELIKERGIEVGSIFNLGKMNYVNNFNYKDSEGVNRDILGVYHQIDIYKLLSGVVEKNNDDDGIVWPMKVAPYQVIVSILAMKNDEKVLLGERIYKELKSLGIEALLDDRDERAGAKFKDADLLGIPIRITIGKKADKGIVEYKLRWKAEKEELTVNEAINKTIELLKNEELI